MDRLQKRNKGIYLITGATGFVGGAVMKRLISDKSLAVGVVRLKPIG